MFKLRAISGVILSAIILAGCASTPTWEGMSENEIAAWRSLDIEAAEAQGYRKAGLGTDDIEAWRSAGLSASESILAWHEAGWSPTTAEPWLKQQFGLELHLKGTQAEAEDLLDQVRNTIERKLGNLNSRNDVHAHAEQHHQTKAPQERSVCLQELRVVVEAFGTQVDLEIADHVPHHENKENDAGDCHQHLFPERRTEVPDGLIHRPDRTPSCLF